ncbi:MAG: InlB B-repeat-containing protein, partial [Ruminococcus sp.]|nr:InlB B-repeat-containing protein [Ruminococcus sp.]
MKTKISRISRRSVSLVLSVLMIVSLFMVGTISASAGGGSTTGNWYISNSMQGTWDSTSAYQLTRSSATDYYKDFYFTKSDTSGLSFRFWSKNDNNKLGAYYGNDYAVPSSTSGTSKDHAGQGVWGWSNTWKFTPSSQLTNSNCFYKVRIHLSPAGGYTGDYYEYNETRYFSGRTWYTATKLANMSPVIDTKNGSTSTDTFNVGDTVSLSASVTSGSNVGTVSYTYKYKKSTDASYSSNVTSFTPSNAGKYIVQVTATDGGVTTSGTKNAFSARTETATKEITVVDPDNTTDELDETSGKTLVVSYDNQSTKYKNIYTWGGISTAISTTLDTPPGAPNASLTNVSYKFLNETNASNSQINIILAENGSWRNQTNNIENAGFVKGKQWYVYNTAAHTNKSYSNAAYTALSASEIKYSNTIKKGSATTIKVTPAGGLPWFKNEKSFAGTPNYQLSAYTNSGRTTSAATAVTSTYGNDLSLSWTPSSSGSVTLYFRLTDGIDTVDFEKTFEVTAPQYTGLSASKQYTVNGSSYSTLSSGTAPTIGAASVDQGSSVSVSAATISGYTFATWYSANGSFASATSASTTFTPTSNSAVAIARYKKNYTFSGTKNGTGSGTLTVPSGTKLAGESFTISVSPSTGSTLTAFTVNGVNKLSSVSNGSYTANASFSTTTSIPVVATFTLNTYTISYAHGSNGTGTVDSTSKSYGVDATLSNSTFTSSRTGYEQDGWSTTDGGAKAYELGGTYTANSSTTLYPHWKLIDYNVKKSETGGTGTITIGDTTLTTSDQSKAYGSYTITVTAPSGKNISAISSPSGSWSGIGTGTATLTGYTLSADLT